MATKKELRLQVYNKYKGHCAYCGEEIPLEKMQVDHLEPVYRESKFDYEKRKIVATGKMLKPENDCFENMMPACRVCNNWKHSFSVEGFRYELNKQVERLNNFSSNYRIAKKYGLVNESTMPVVFYFEIASDEQA